MPLPRLEKERILRIVASALKEDIGPRDVTTQPLVPKAEFAKAELLARQTGVIAGLQVAEWAFGQVEPKIRFKPTVRDGAKVFAGKAVAFIEGPARGILMAERVALNFVSRLSGIATLTRVCVNQARAAAKRGTVPVRIMDTRKTTPNLRVLEKYAVAVGGGRPHRTGLYDQVLIKDNHLKIVAKRLAKEGTLGGKPYRSAVEAAVAQVRAKNDKKLLVEVEVSNMMEFRQALSAKADIVLLDNMRLSEIQEAVRLRNALSRSKRRQRVRLEVSGGVTLKNVGTMAGTGVDRISIGALTHSVRSLDLSLEMIG
jgi:nicotinate-nucleotide pyrophosphorylase (carboxylating)